MADEVASDAADQRWTVRGVPVRYRQVAAAAADRAKLSIGAWLCEAIDRAVQFEREPIDALAPPPAVAADARLAVVERAVAAAVSLAEASNVPVSFRRRANRLLRESLPAATAPARRLAIAAPDE